MTGCDDCCGGVTDARDIDKPFRRVLWIALIANAAMFGVELYASFAARSVALQADAMDFFADAANYSISLFVLGMSLRARAMAAFIKAGTMGLFGLWVLGMALYRLITGGAPEPFLMGPVALMALAVNVAVALMLFAYREGDANRQSIWLCSRNDAIANTAVFAAAGLVWVTGEGWPDILVAAGIAALGLSSAWRVTGQARREWREERPALTPGT